MIKLWFYQKIYIVSLSKLERRKHVHQSQTLLRRYTIQVRAERPGSSHNQHLHGDDLQTLTSEERWGTFVWSLYGQYLCLNKCFHSPLFCKSDVTWCHFALRRRFQNTMVKSEHVTHQSSCGLNSWHMWMMIITVWYTSTLLYNAFIYRDIPATLLQTHVPDTTEETHHAIYFSMVQKFTFT